MLDFLRVHLELCPRKSVVVQEKHSEMFCGGPGDDARFPYRDAIGNLMHLMIGTRVDIAFAVETLVQFCQSPAQEHWMAVKHLLMYVRGTRDHGILYDSQGGLILEGYFDAVWGGVRSRKSTSDLLFKLGGGAVRLC